MDGRPSAGVKSSVVALGLAVLFVLLSGIRATGLGPGLAAAGQEETFAEALDLFQRGRAEEARQKFEEVLAENPSHEQALAMYQTASEEIWLQMLLKSDPYEAIAKRFAELARMGRKEKSADVDQIRAQVQKIVSGDYAAMREAQLALSADHGSYAVAEMWSFLGDDDVSVRVNMMLALRNLGSDAVLPLVGVLGADDERVRANVAATLGALGDRRAIPALRAVAADDTSDVVKRQAAEALTKLGVTGDRSAASSWCDLAVDYFRDDAQVVPPFDPFHVIWTFENGRLAAREVSWRLYNLELSEQACFAALALDAGETRAQEILLATYAAEKAELVEAAAAGEEFEGGEELLAALDVALSSGGGDSLLKALDLSLDTGADLAAGTLCSVLGDLRFKGAPLERALDSRDKIVSYPAALAMVAGGSVTPRVIDRLVEAVSESAIRQVLVIDDNDATRNEFLEGLAGKGYSVVTASNGGMGLMRAKEFPPKDVVVVRADLKEMHVDAIIRAIKDDERTAETPILLISARDDLGDIATLYEDRVAAHVKLPADADVLAGAIEGVLEPLNSSRQRAAAMSSQAAAALASLDAASLGAAVDALVACLQNRPDDVRIAALEALGKVGATVAVPAASEVFNDSSTPAPVRVAAAGALAGIFPNLSSSPGETVVEGLLTGIEDADASVRMAAARALGAARFLDAAVRTRILQANRPQ